MNTYLNLSERMIFFYLNGQKRKFLQWCTKSQHDCFTGLSRFFRTEIKIHIQRCCIFSFPQKILIVLWEWSLNQFLSMFPPSNQKISPWIDRKLPLFNVNWAVYCFCLLKIHQSWNWCHFHLFKKKFLIIPEDQ